VRIGVAARVVWLLDVERVEHRHLLRASVGAWARSRARPGLRLGLGLRLRLKLRVRARARAREG